MDHVVEHLLSAMREAEKLKEQVLKIQQLLEEVKQLVPIWNEHTMQDGFGYSFFGCFLGPLRKDRNVFRSLQLRLFLQLLFLLSKILEECEINDMFRYVHFSFGMFWDNLM